VKSTFDSPVSLSNIGHTIANGSAGEEDITADGIGEHRLVSSHTTPLDVAATRMLLSSDGSTTILLEALLKCHLCVRVESQETVCAGKLLPDSVSALGLSPESTAVERRSALLTPTGTVVSRNIVVFAVPLVGWNGSPTDPTPLGKRLREQKTRQHREILSFGISEWPDAEGRRRCTYKEYVITFEDGLKMYIREKFNPDLVSLSAP
jgi:chorismate-pyruvate lyase